MNLERLRTAIAELHQLLVDLVDKLEESGWSRPPAQRQPEQRSTHHNFGSLDMVSPERAPLPGDAAALYQRWFSGARAIIDKNQRSRLEEFDSLHKAMHQFFSHTYMSQSQQFSVMDALSQQAAILGAVPDHVLYSAVDLELKAYATLMDDEIGAARTLLEHGFLRPAGALAGVILERHLKNLLRKNDPPVAFSENATLSILNNLCKEAVYDLITWRRVQHLADIRNLCAHEKEREPTAAEVDQLLAGVSGILRTHL